MFTLMQHALYSTKLHIKKALSLSTNTFPQKHATLFNMKINKKILHSHMKD
jgi:hypothetical protein